jgi:hypothetical protein
MRGSWLPVFRMSCGSMLLLVLAACGSSRAPAEEAGRRIPDGVTVVKGGSSGFRNSIREAVRDSVRWRIIWDSLYYDPKPSSLPQVDFQREMLVVAAGPLSGVGDSVVISRITPDRRKLRVRVVLYQGCNPSQGSTMPFHVVRVHRASQEPVFEERVVTQPECIE